MTGRAARWEAVLQEAIARTGGGAVPEEVRRRAALIVADTLAVAVAGGRASELSSLVGLWADGARARDGAVAFTPGRPVLAVEHAAWVNAMAATWLDLDEAADAGVHAGSHVLVPVLAAGQRIGATGAAVLDAFLLGYEATAALYRAYPTPYPIHPHAGPTAVGAAAAVAALQGRDPFAAAAVAVTLPMSVTWDACFEGATARHAFAAATAATALRAADLAHAGVTGSRTALDTLYGLIGRADQRPNRAGDDAVEGFEVLRGSFKFNGACLTSHAAVDAARALAGVPADRVDRVDVRTTASVVEKTARQPAPNDLSAGFSVQYAVAAALTHGEALLPIRYEAEVAELARRVHVAVDPDLPGGEHDFPARVTVVEPDGTAHERAVVHPRGHFAITPSTGELRAKAAALDTSAAFEAGLALADVGDVRHLAA